MKKIALVIALVVAALLVNFTFIAAQETDAQKAYGDYLVKLDVYRNDYSQFIKARDFYLRTKTLVQKENVRLVTYDLLVARDDLMASYIDALRTKLIETPQHPGNERGDIISDLVGESPWYLNHKSTYDKTNDSLETLFTKSDEFKKEYDTVTSSFIYRALSILAFSKYLNLKNRLENVYNVAKSAIDKVPDSEKSLYDRWTRDIDIAFQKVTDVENKVKEIRLQFSDPKAKPQDIYNSLITKLGEGRSPLLAVDGFLKELISALNI